MDAAREMCCAEEVLRIGYQEMCVYEGWMDDVRDGRCGGGWDDG